MKAFLIVILFISYKLGRERSPRKKSTITLFKPTKKFKYIKGKNDTFVALPVVGIINMLTYGIPILILDYFYKFL